jgi:flagellar secretion chaperone FliS
LLMDTALERMAAARGCIEHGETVRKAKLLHNCTRIVAELRGSLNMAQGGSLAQNLNELYDYMIGRLLIANAESSAQRVTEVMSLLGEIRGAWAAIGPEVKHGTPAASSAA